MNTALFYAINSFAASAESISQAVVFLAEDFGYLLIVLLAYFLATHEDKRRGAREVAVMVLTATLAWLLAHAIKYIYYEPRPFAAFSDVRQLIPHEADSSFPSGHAVFFSALATAMWFYHKRLAVLLGIGAILIGAARVAAGVHYPTDILAGFILGVAVAFVAARLLDKYALVAKRPEKS